MAWTEEIVALQTWWRLRIRPAAIKKNWPHQAANPLMYILNVKVNVKTILHSNKFLAHNKNDHSVQKNKNV